MKGLLTVTMAAAVLAGAALAQPVEAGQGRGNSNGKGKSHEEVKPAGHDVAPHGGTSVSVQVVWGRRDVEVIRAHYAKQPPPNLPPGLAKKYARTGQLPPGWQKKMQPLPREVERTLPPLPTGYRRGVIDARAVIYDTRGTIVDIAVLF